MPANSFQANASQASTSQANASHDSTSQANTSQDSAAFLPEAGTITMFSTSWCGYCRRLKSQLDTQGVGYREVNIEDVPGTAELVESLNNGNQTVPTVLFPDGSAATNPSAAEVKSRLGI